MQLTQEFLIQLESLSKEKYKTVRLRNVVPIFITGMCVL